MKKQLLCAVAVAAVAFGLSGVNAHAQDVASDVSAQAATVVPAAPAATPAPAPRPAFLGGSGGRFTFYAGYAYLNSNFTQGNDGEGDCGLCDGRQGSNGVAVSATYWLNPNFGLTADFSGNNGSQTFTYDDGFSYRVNQSSWYFLFGPSVQKNIGHVNLFAHALVGVARLYASEDDRDAPGEAFFRENTIPLNSGIGVGVGGGADWMFTHTFGWRIAQVDWLWSTNEVEGEDCPGCFGAVSNVRISTGIVVNLGGSK